MRWRPAGLALATLLVAHRPARALASPADGADGAAPSGNPSADGGGPPGLTAPTATPIDPAAPPTTPAADDLMAPEYADTAPPRASDPTTAAPIDARPGLPRRPTAWSIGIGAGFRLPGKLSQPDVASARFRLASGLTVEPLITLGTQTVSSNDGTTVTEQTSSQFGLGAQLRWPLRSRGRADLELLGGAAYDRTTTDTAMTASFSSADAFAVTWGLGLQYWITAQWSLSVSATNPVLTYRKFESPSGVAGVTAVSEVTEVDAHFAPLVTAMLHLYL